MALVTPTLEGIKLSNTSGTYSSDDKGIVGVGTSPHGYLYVVKGTFTSGTVLLELQMADGNWQNISQRTTNGQVELAIPVGQHFRIRLDAVVGSIDVEVSPRGGY